MCDCKTLPTPYITDQRKILFWKKELTCDNVTILACIRKLGFGMTASKYNIPLTNLNVHEIKHRMWKHFVDTLTDSRKIIFL